MGPVFFLSDSEEDLLTLDRLAGIQTPQIILQRPSTARLRLFLCVPEERARVYHMEKCSGLLIRGVAADDQSLVFLQKLF